MALVPISYNLRSLFVRKTMTLLCVVSVGATVAVVCGVLALQQGFASIFHDSGRTDLAVILRQGALDEGSSWITREQARILAASMPEVDRDADGQPLASEEIYVAARLRKRDGGETNVPIRGVGQATLALRGVHLTMVAGRPIREGQDEVMVGRALTHRIQHCELGDVIVFNTTPLRVVGIFAHEGPLESEIWGDLERIREALDRPPGCSRLLVQLRPDADLEALAARLEEDERTPASIFTEQKYLEGQTEAMSTMLGVLARILGVIMGVAAIFTGANTMQAALAARSHEVGILLALGYRPFSIFVSFLFEAMVLGLLGGLVGCLFVLPLHGIRTGTTNWQSFTEVAFAFRVTPGLLLVACGFAAGLGLLGGALPALRAADLDVVEALRRG